MEDEFVAEICTEVGPLRGALAARGRMMRAEPGWTARARDLEGDAIRGEATRLDGLLVLGDSAENEFPWR